MRKSICVLLGLVMAGCSDDPTKPGSDEFNLRYVTPEDVGWSSAALEDAHAFAEQSGYAAVMAATDGQVFFSWGNIDRHYWCHSIRKPFLSALYGIYLEAGDLDLQATLAELEIDDIPPSLTEAEKQATVQQLLQSRSGIYHEAAAEAAAMIALRPERGSHAPGTFFYYNNWDFNALGTIFEQETGIGIFDAFQTHLAGPMGMEDFSADSCTYQYELEKSSHPAYHFRMSARDMLRFATLYQMNGAWGNRQIVPTHWIEESTHAYSVEDSASGLSYGYMWRVFPEGSAISEMIGHAGYYHTGVGVHAMIIVPELKLVLVERYDTDGEWTDPGEVGLTLGMMIIQARIEEES